MEARKRHSVLVGRSLEPRHIVWSITLHLLILFALGLLPAAHELPDDAVHVELVVENGSAGTKGGAAGGGGQPQSSEPQQSAQPQAEETPPVEQPPPPPPPAEVAEIPLEPTPVPPPPEPQVQPEPPKPPPPPPPKATQRSQPASALPIPQPGTAASGSATEGPGGQAGSGQGAKGQGAGVAGAGQGPGDEYFEKLRRHLLKFKYFPDAASQKKEEGTVGVEFTIARDGTVLAAKIDQGSGFALLDAAALDMLHKASPVPPLPDYISGDRVTVAIPVEFKLGFFDRLF